MKRSFTKVLGISMLLGTLLISCGPSSKMNGVELSLTKPQYQSEDHTTNYVDDLYKNYYQVLVYSYFDSDGDGIGDLKGLTSKLDYINNGDKNSTTSLGYDGLYLLPIHPSPTYHKYDTTNYYEIDPTYGTMEDFDNFIKEANKRGIDVILDMAFNHTSSEHPKFKQAINAAKRLTDWNKETGEPLESDYEKYPELRYYHIIHNSFEKDYGVAKWHRISGTPFVYEGSFYSGMPDLNFEQDVVLDEVKNIMKFWLDKGVRGFRLDAVQHFFDYHPERNYDVLNQIADFGKELTKNREKDCYLVAEGPWSANVANYYEGTKGKNISYMNFNFASSGSAKLFTAINNMSLYNKKFDKLTEEGVEIKYSTAENNNGMAFNIINNGLDVRSASDYFRAIVTNWLTRLHDADPKAIDANFGTNHDTLRAINTISGRYEDKELVQVLKFFWGLNNTLSGVTFNYYGEEIGMKAGAKTNDPDKRHPMYFSDSKKGRPNIAPLGNEFKEILPPADKQMKDSNSLWNFMRELNRAKAFFPEIARGEQRFIKTAPQYCVMEKSYNGNKINLVYNFSNKALKINKSELGLEEEVTEIKYSLSSSSSHYSKLTADSLNVPAYSITII